MKLSSKMIKKRILALMMVGTMLVPMGCSKDNNNQETTQNPQPTKSSSSSSTTIDQNDLLAEINAANGFGDDNDDSGIEVTRSDKEYEYTQTKNIIDDNYRNYYQVLVYSYYDSNNDGIGDINGLIQKLDYIQDMGFNGIWLSPIHPSTSYHKYNVRDYYDIDPKFGTVDDFKNLLAECHKRDIRVIMDFVINHTGSDHEWFISAKNSVKIEPCGKAKCNVEGLCREHNKYVNYYNFTQNKTGSEFKPIGDGWYYEAYFDSAMPDLNLENPELRKNLEAIMKYWLDMGVDGYRLDAAMHYVESDTDKNNEIINWLTTYCKSINKNTYIVAEVWTNFTALVEYYKSGIDSNFNFLIGTSEGRIAQAFNNTNEKYSLSSYAKLMAENESDINKRNPNGIDAPFITNHDMPRYKGYFRTSGDNGVQKAYNNMKMANAMLYILQGSPFTYYGEEIGMASIAGRDENYRAPMYWSNTDMTGVTKLNNCAVQFSDHIYGSVEEQQKDKYSLLNFVKRCIQLRNENPEIARGTTTVIDEFNNGMILAVTKEYNGSKIIILMNASGKAAQFDISKSTYGYEGIRGYLSCDDAVVTLDGEKLTLPNNTMVVLK